MTWPTEIQTKYDEELGNVVFPLITTKHPGYQSRKTDLVYQKNEELNQALENPTGNKQEWMALVDTLRSELSALIEQDNQVVVDNHEADVNYRDAVIAETAVLKEVSANKWNAVRNTRNWLLSQCDWTQIADAPLTSEKKTSWGQYRQSLRDLPETYTTVESVVWPVKPE